MTVLGDEATLTSMASAAVTVMVVWLMAGIAATLLYGLVKSYVARTGGRRYGARQ